MHINAVLCSSLEKIFSDDVLVSSFDKLSLLFGERGNFQIALSGDVACTMEIKCLSENVGIYEVKNIYSATPIHKEEAGDTLLVNDGMPGYYPDLLDNFNGNLKLNANETKAIWIEIDSSLFNIGESSIDFLIKSEDEEIKLSAKIEVLQEKLPPQEIIHINWFHSDCLASYYGVDVFSDEYWRITENFIKNAVMHGVNCILTPIFTPPLDTQVGGERPTVQLVGVTRRQYYKYDFDFTLLQKYIDICIRNGVEYFEFSHLYTQWGAEHAPKIMANTPNGVKRIFGWETKATSDAYTNFLSQLSVKLKEFTDKNNITDKCFIHCSDEPNIEQLNNYKKASDIVRKYFSCYEHIDALSDYDFYQNGLIGTPVPEEGNIDAFFGNVPKLWTYYCCGQFKDNLPNRFFSMPSVKNRILGVLLYKYNCTGFLHWGFNFYYSQYSIRLIDPFTETDAGGAFPSGDSFVVYPGKNGQPLSSLRQKVFYDAFQDISALKAYEKRTSREAVLEFIKSELGDINFRNYPLENKVFLTFRENLNKKLK